ncbi:MAG TPA: hypothetical protein GXX41_14065 [Thermoanaerobacterium sp.]|nr:hypothetical protein [Thermoanaerobacterium sp.]
MAASKRSREADEELMREALELGGDSKPLTTLKELRPLKDLPPAPDNVPPFDPALESRAATQDRAEPAKPPQSPGAKGVQPLPKRITSLVLYSEKNLHLYLPVPYHERFSRLAWLILGGGKTNARATVTLTSLVGLSMGILLHLIDNACGHLVDEASGEDADQVFARMVQERVSSGDFGPGGLLEAIIDQLNELLVSKNETKQ